MTEMVDAERALVIALDVPRVDDARRLVETIALPNATYKIGLELLFAGGLSLVKELAAAGYSIFVDAKLLDIANTVERAAAQIALSGARFLTVHAQDTATLQAARRGVDGSSVNILGVTVLTNISQTDLYAQGHETSVSELVLRRARFAHQTGCYGVVASVYEARMIRETLAANMIVVTPGIRPASSNHVTNDDQARSATPETAILAGATMIVVGRPILKATDPAATARSIVAEIANAKAA